MLQRRSLQIALRAHQEEELTIASSYQKTSTFCYLTIPTKKFLFQMSEENEEQKINEPPDFLIAGGERNMVSDEELMEIA
jgi:hypothetical protein